MFGRSVSRSALLAAGAAVLCGVSASPAWATQVSAASSTGTAGIDVSYPQCSSALPAGEAFAVVGVNGGLANDYNSCLGSQFAYARTSTGVTKQAPAQTYLNTADPGNAVADWPSPAQLGAYGSTGTPSGSCGYANGVGGAGANSPGCAYVYGYDMVAGMTFAGGSIAGDAPTFTSATGGQLSAQPVWLDVETGNTWQTGSAGLAMNVADLQGMVDAIRATATAGTAAAAVGMYSTGAQWNQITGTPTGAAAGDLAGTPVWVPGAHSQKAAIANCSATSFTGGPVTLTQWFGTPYDGDHSCTG